MRLSKGQETRLKISRTNFPSRKLSLLVVLKNSQLQQKERKYYQFLRINKLKRKDFLRPKINLRHLSMK
jgi:hypothetical protein